MKVVHKPIRRGDPHQRTENNYNLEGLTVGKLLAIFHALDFARQSGKLTTVGEDVLICLRHADIDALAEV